MYNVLPEKPNAPKTNGTNPNANVNLIITLNSRKRSKPSGQAIIGKTTDCGVIAIKNTPNKVSIDQRLADLNGTFKKVGAVKNSAIWFHDAVWLCFLNKLKAEEVVRKYNGMTYYGAKLTVEFHQNPPNLLVETHFAYLRVPLKTNKAKNKEQDSKRIKISSAHASTTISSGHSGTISSSPNGEATQHNRPSIITGDSQLSLPFYKNRPDSLSGPVSLSTGSIEIERLRGDVASCSPIRGLSNRLPNESSFIESELNATRNLKSIDTVSIRSSNHYVTGDLSNSTSNGTTSFSAHGEEKEEPFIISGSSYFSLNNSNDGYKFSEDIIFPIRPFSKFEDSDIEITDDLNDEIFSAISADQFIQISGFNLGSYPNTWWLLCRLLRNAWPFGVLKIIMVRGEIYIQFISSAAARNAIPTFARIDLLLPPLKMKLIEAAPVSVISLIRSSASSSSPWCFTSNLNLNVLATEVPELIEAKTFSRTKSAAANFGAIFVKAMDNKIWIAFPDEKKIIRFVIFMKQVESHGHKYNLDVDVPDSLFASIRDCDLTGASARLAQIVIQRRLNLLADIQSIHLQYIKSNADSENHQHSETELPEQPSSGSIEADQLNPVPSCSENQALASTSLPSPSSLQNDSLTNYFIKLVHRPCHNWYLLYDILSKTWFLKVIKIIFDSSTDETWIEVPHFVDCSEFVFRLESITYLSRPLKAYLITKVPYRYLNLSVSSGSSPWCFTNDLKLRFLKIGPVDLSNIAADVKCVKKIVEDEHAIFVKYWENAIWSAFPDDHTSLQALLTVNHEQRLKTGLKAIREKSASSKLLSSIEIADLVGVNRDLAKATLL